MTETPATDAEFTLSPELAERLAQYDPDPSAPLPPEPSWEDEIYWERLNRALLRVPKKYQDADLLLCPAAVQGWCDGLLGGSAAPGLMLTGPTGTGKTFAAFAAVTYLLAAGIPSVERYTEPQLLGHLRTEIDQAEDVLTRLEEAPLILLDDLGSARHTEWAEEVIYRLVDARYAEQAPLIVATNLPRRDLADRLGARVASRLLEMCEIVPILGPDGEGADRRLG